ncbi:MAG: hypothetical protein ABSB74_20435 [Tepidisphaeraceae bacterium]
MFQQAFANRKHGAAASGGKSRLSIAEGLFDGRQGSQRRLRRQRLILYE